MTGLVIFKLIDYIGLNDFVLKYLFICLNIHCFEMAKLSLRGEEELAFL